MLVALPFFSLIAEGIETIVLGSYPYHGSLGIIYHAVQFAARDALPVSPLIIIKKAVAIKAVQALFGSNPEKAMLILRHAHHIVARQSLFQPNRSNLILLGMSSQMSHQRQEKYP